MPDDPPQYLAAAQMGRLLSCAAWIAVFVLVIMVLAVARTSYSIYLIQNRTREHATFIEDLQTLELCITTAESSQRGYILTNDNSFLQHLGDSLERIPHLLVRLSNDDPRDALDKPEIEKLAEFLADKMGHLRESIIVMRDRPAAAQAMVKQGYGRRIMEEIREMDGRLFQRKKKALEDTAAQLQQALLKLTVAILSIVLISIGAIIVGHRYARRDLKLRARAESELASALQTLEQKNAEVGLIGKFSDRLQVCFTKEEAFAAIELYVRAVLPEAAGYLGVFSNSRNRLDVVGSWGAETASGSYEPSDCNSLRSGRVYCRAGHSMDLRCRHADSSSDPNTVCIPLTAQGETLGALHLSLQDDDFSDDGKLTLVKKLAERAALALANLRLQEKLTNQSIRDPLTGLFNRRYMEEALDREIHRADRRGTKLGVMMIDLDYFKRFNDSYGHDAGDRILQEVGATLRSYFRQEDIPCRFGGEELTVILPDVRATDLHTRAAGLVAQIAGLRVQHSGQFLPPVTASVGTALYPDSALSSSKLISAADGALYQAKAAGRNCCKHAASTKAQPSPGKVGVPA